MSKGGFDESILYNKKAIKKGTGYFLCIDCPHAKTVLLIQEKVACPFFLKSSAP
jgi:hypothetical protein